MAKRLAAPVIVEILLPEDGLDGPACAAVDVLQVVNQLAQMRGAKRPPCLWRWTTPAGGALRRAGSPSRPQGKAHIVVLGGWRARNGPHLDRLVRRDSAACSRLRAVHAAGGHVLALYTGVALVGEAGLLQGRHAVVAWPFIPSVLRHAPQRQRLVKAIAQESASRVGPGSLERARRWLEDHLHEPYSLAATARAANTSGRSLLRHFRATFDKTPLQMLHELRVTQARMLLETTYLPLETVSERCGWRDPAMLRKVFQRETGLSPARYRERYRLRSERRQWGRDLER
jgi:transcriptional regulator GlxA family with amidase domain